MGLLAYSVLIKKMEHIPGWGSSPWSQAPTDNTFRLVSSRALYSPQAPSFRPDSGHRSPQMFPFPWLCLGG